jgi:hypothetical protein
MVLPSLRYISARAECASHCFGRFRGRYNPGQTIRFARPRFDITYQLRYIVPLCDRRSLHPAGRRIHCITGEMLPWRQHILRLAGRFVTPSSWTGWATIGARILTTSRASIKLPSGDHFRAMRVDGISPGAHTSHAYMGYVEGTLSSGYRLARRLAVRDKILDAQQQGVWVQGIERLGSRSIWIFSRRLQSQSMWTPFARTAEGVGY